jgi:hypothetical protein
MPKLKKEDWPEVVRQIMEGEHDDTLDLIQSAAKARIKNMWRKQMRIRVHGSKNPDLEGVEGVITKVNVKTITVGLGDAEVTQFGTIYSKGEWNMSPGLLEKI